MSTPLPIRPPETDLARAVARGLRTFGHPGTAPVTPKKEQGRKV